MKRIDTFLRAAAIALFIIMCLLSAAFASSEETSGEGTENIEYEYEITITPPRGWYVDSADITITICDLNETGWESAELIFPGTGGTMNISGSSTEVAVSENGTYTVRVTDPAGSAHEESTLVECFDTAAPTVTAGIRDKVLHCEASDDQSGVYGIMVDEKLYTTLHDGALDLRLEDYSGAGKTLSVTAIDNIGNRSALTRIDNPYYSDATPTPAATNAPVIIYTGTEPTLAPTAASSATRTASTASSAQTTSSTGNAATTTTTATTPVSTTTTHTVQDTTADEAEETPQPQEEIELTPGVGFSGNGNAVTRDLLYDQYANKQFITVQTRSGNTFYLIIDYDKVSDEDAEAYQTYFLNPVDEADLLALLDDDAITALTGSGDDAEKAPAVCTCKEKCVIGSIDTACPVCRTNLSECTGMEIVTPAPEPTAEAGEGEQSETGSGSKAGGVLAVFLVFGVIGGGVFYFLKNKKTKPQTAGSTDFDDYDLGEEDDELEIPEEDEEHDRPSGDA